MSNDDEINFMVEKIKYTSILAHKDLDGALATGLLLRIFQLPFDFSYELIGAERTIIVEVPIAEGAEVVNCLIVDHHNCEEYVGLSGNIIICDEDYPSVSSLVADFFELEIDENLLYIIEDIDNGEIFGNDKTMKFFFAYISNIDRFPFKKLALLVKDMKWDEINSLFEKLYDDEKVESLLKLAEEKASNATFLKKNLAIITYNPDNVYDSSIARVSSLLLQEKGYTVATVAVSEEGVVLFGRLATKQGKNLNKIYKSLRKIGFKAGGRKNVGGFKALQRITFEEFEKLINSLL